MFDAEQQPARTAIQGAADASQYLNQLQTILHARARDLNYQNHRLLKLEKILHAWILSNSQGHGHPGGTVVVQGDANAHSTTGDKAEAGSGGEDGDEEEEEEEEEAAPSAAILRMDSELDRVLAKAKRVRIQTDASSSGIATRNRSDKKVRKTPGSRKSKQHSKSSTEANNRAETRKRSATGKTRVRKAGDTTTSTPTVPQSFMSTSPIIPQRNSVNSSNLHPVELKLMKTEATKRSRYLQKLHGQIDLGEIRAAKTSFIGCLKFQAPLVKGYPEVRRHQGNIASDVDHLGQHHLESFLAALDNSDINESRQDKVLDNDTTTDVLAEDCLLDMPGSGVFHHFGIVSYGETMLDQYLFGVLSAPSDDMLVWQELRQVSLQQSSGLSVQIESALDRIARVTILPCLSRLFSDITESGNSARSQDLLVLYRLVDSLANRKGLSFLRVLGNEE